MKIYSCALISFLLCGFLYSCANNKSQKNVSVQTTALAGGDSLQNLDYNQDLSKRSLQDLRILRNLPYAKQGYCFMQADLRAFFASRLPKYDSMLWSRYDYDDAHPPAPIKLSAEEQAFCKKVADAEKERLKENYIDRGGAKVANIANIINLFQFSNLSGDYLNALDKNNFFIAPSDGVQLFHLYEGNDYHAVPNYVTTDLYLQLYHMYFSFVLRSLEEDKFIPVITELSDGMYTEAAKAAASGDESVRANAEFTEVFYAVPYCLLTAKKKPLPARYQALFEKEISAITAESDDVSEFLGTSPAVFGYSLFKPRGHYTRTDKLKKYFKAMMWLQTAVFCRDQPAQLKRTIFMASMLNGGKSSTGKSLLSLYNAVFEPIVFLIGEPDNLSVNDITSFLAKNNITDPGAAIRQSTLDKADAYLKETVKARNRIKPKIEISCPDKINFMPQRYLFDNEILLDLADVAADSKRGFPKGLDIFAALGNKTAEKILLNEYKEGDNWKDYPGELNNLKKKFENYPSWNATVYNKWMSILNRLQAHDDRYPYYMSTDAWDRKNLYTALGSWAELKHDAILYGEEPAAAECGGPSPPDPISVGYVEPNIIFWKGMTELLALTEEMLKKNDLLTGDIAEKTKSLNETAQFLLTASEKELKHQKLSEQEYNTIRVIGASAELMTLSILAPDKAFKDWTNVSGPDKSMSVVADVYTRNVAGNNNNGILYEGVGKVNAIYVVVEIEGYLYITRGATFSYYEFVEPMGSRLTDEEWQKKLDSRQDLPPVPQWMKDIILPAKNAPAVDEKLKSYSSGC